MAKQKPWWLDRYIVSATILALICLAFCAVITINGVRSESRCENAGYVWVRGTCIDAKEVHP